MVGYSEIPILPVNFIKMFKEIITICAYGAPLRPSGTLPTRRTTAVNYVPSTIIISNSLSIRRIVAFRSLNNNVRARIHSARGENQEKSHGSRATDNETMSGLGRSSIRLTNLYRFYRSLMHFIFPFHSY